MNAPPPSPPATSSTPPPAPIDADARRLFHALVVEAAAPYRPAGPNAYWFARGKLGGDPVFRALLARGLLPARGRIVDLGCGQGVLEALLGAALRCHARGRWPRGWPPPPQLEATGVDLRRAGIERARIACGAAAQFELGDIRTFPLPPCEAIVILDVLHYVDAAAQEQVLQRCHAALRDGGSLLLRVTDPEGGWRARMTTIGDQLISALRGMVAPRLHTRPAGEWMALLRRIGFDVDATPMSEGTPFSNVLLVARARSHGSGDDDRLP